MEKVHTDIKVNRSVKPMISLSARYPSVHKDLVGFLLNFLTPVERDLSYGPLDRFLPHGQLLCCG